MVRGNFRAKAAPSTLIPGRALAEQVFSRVAGAPLPPEEILDPESLETAGEANLRVIATAPNTAGLYRHDNLVAALERAQEEFSSGKACQRILLVYDESDEPWANFLPWTW